MAKYLFLKHYRGAPTPVNDVPMDQWAPEEVDAQADRVRRKAEREGLIREQQPEDSAEPAERRVALAGVAAERAGVGGVDRKPVLG